MFYPRAIVPALEKELTSKETTVITGMRRSGKTFILKHLFESISSKNKIILDLEDPLNRKIFENESYDNIWTSLSPFGINNQEKSYIFLDEIQNLPTIPKVIKYLYDHYQVKFVVTGSSSYYLKNLFSESLSGRKLIFEIYPLSFAEFLIFKNQKPIFGKNRVFQARLLPYFEEYQQFGGFPSVVLEPDYERKGKILREIFTSYFEIDAKSLSDFEEMNKLRDLILMLTSRVGGQLDVQSLSSELGLSRETVYNYLVFLEKTYFIKLINRFSGSVRRQSAGNAKLYFCDGGMANVLGKLSSGQAIEQAVFQVLRSSENLNYYRHKDDEIDFIVNKTTAIEVKETGNRRDLDRLSRIATKLKLTKTLILAKNYSEEANILPITTFDPSRFKPSS